MAEVETEPLDRMVLKEVTAPEAVAEETEVPEDWLDPEEVVRKRMTTPRALDATEQAASMVRSELAPQGAMGSLL